MHDFETIHQVGHSAEKMFALVADVENYPKFVPLCESLKVRARRAAEGNRETLIADMTVAYKVFRETFTSKVVLDPDYGRILVDYLDGPFTRLENHWAFTAQGENACDVEFFISYEFRSRTLGTLMGAVFDHAFRRFVHAFETRADTVYGAPR